MQIVIVVMHALFLSTLSLRRATVVAVLYIIAGTDFYPRSPCGERHTQNFTALHNILISIHALLAESDDKRCKLGRDNRISIHALLAESDPSKTRRLTNLMISIHALLAESDARNTRDCVTLPNFYPRSPCGERHDYKGIQHPPVCISIHALLAESDFAAIPPQNP